MTFRSDWQQETLIRSYEAGTDGKAGIAMICNLLQECAAVHASHLGISFEFMQSRKLAWAVARMGLEIHRRPAVWEKLIVQTWINGTRGPFAMREFEVLDASSVCIARATYAWLAVDTASKKPVRPLELVGGYPPPPDRPNLDAALGKIPNPVNPVSSGSFRTFKSDIDMHLHVNNTRYIAWIEDALATVGGEHEVRWLQVNFLAEAFAGDTIEVATGTIPEKKLDEGRIVVLKRTGDGAEFIRALAVFGPVEEAERIASEHNGETITEVTLAAASKIAGLPLTASERAQALEKVSGFTEDYRKRRAVKLDNDLGPAEVFTGGDGGGVVPPVSSPPVSSLGASSRAAFSRAVAPGAASSSPAASRPVVSRPTGGVKSAGESARQVPDFPANDVEVAFAPLRNLSAWLQRGDITSTRLCELYLDRLKRYDPVLSCVITLTEERAMRQAARADAELSAGKRRGPLHGIPWGAKDLLDTKGIRTTWGATPYKNRVPDTDAAVVKLLDDAGAVLVGKLTLGALAYNDIWFGGQTKNPWNLEQGSSGSSAGPAAAAAAGLAGFCIGSETMGSIVSPCLRCGTVGLRPSFGMVPRTGAMSLSWSYDKIGPICRRVEDLGFVLEAIAAEDPADPGSRDIPFSFDPYASIEGAKIGYDPEWFAADKDGTGYGDTLKMIDKALGEAGAALVEMRLPDLPYETLFHLVVVDAAAAFEELTLSGADDDLVWQDPEAWPNSFRAARFFPAVEYVQLQRFRRLVAREMKSLFDSVDVMISPERRGPLLFITNSTGQPSLTLRAGFRKDGTPFGVNIWGRFAGEAALVATGMVLERALGAAEKRPPGFGGRNDPADR